jgi:hypothetical protein
MVLETTLAGEVCNVWNVPGEDPWQLSSKTDFHKLSTKPHRSHPNYVFYIDSEPWAARFYSIDAVGINSAAISTMTFLSSAARLYLDGALIRFLPLSGATATRLIQYSILSEGRRLAFLFPWYYLY